jgi:hypothetical protein
VPKLSAVLKMKVMPGTSAMKDNVSLGWVNGKRMLPLPSRTTEVLLPRIPSSSMV